MTSTRPRDGGRGTSRDALTGKTVQTTAGPVGLQVPPDRNGTFDPVTVPQGPRRLRDVDDKIISLYDKGMTTRDIAEHLEATYGASVSHETIANITNAINEQAKEWWNQPPGRGLSDRPSRCDPAKRPSASTHSKSNSPAGAGSVFAGHDRCNCPTWQTRVHLHRREGSPA